MLRNLLCNEMNFNNSKNVKRNTREDKKILGKLRKKDKEAFIRAYDLHVDSIYRFIYFKVSSGEDAQDLTSQVFLKTWNYINNNDITEEKTLRALLYKIARTTIIDHYRKQGQVNVSIDEKDKKIDVIDESQDIAKKIQLEFDIKYIEDKLKELKDEYREIIVMKYIEEMTISEIAQVINKTKGNTRVLVHRAMKSLQELAGEKDK